MLGSKKAIIFAITMVTLGVGYNINHFSKKRIAAVPPIPVKASVASSANSSGSETAIEIQVDLADRLTSILEVTTHDPLEGSVASTKRHPFLLAQEQSEEKPWDKIVEEELERREDEEKRRRAKEKAKKKKKAPKKKPSFQRELINLIAIIDGEDQSYALIGTEILGVGDRIPETDYKISSIRRDSITVRDGDKKHRLRLDQ